MKQKRLLSLLLLLLPLSMLAQGTEQKVFKSTFTGTADDNYRATYASGTLATAEGNDWSWSWSGASGSMPFVKVATVGDANCISFNLKEEQITINSAFGTEGIIKKITVRAGGNLGAVFFDIGTLGGRMVTEKTSDLQNYVFHLGSEANESTLYNKTVNIALKVSDLGSGDPIYLESIIIECELPAKPNGLTSTFDFFDPNTNTLVAQEENNNWQIQFPDDGSDVQSYKATYYSEPCLLFQSTGGSSTYHRFTFTSQNQVQGKVKKIIVKAGGDIHHLYYLKSDGEQVESEYANGSVNGFKDFVLDFDNGMDINDYLQFHLYAGRYLYLQSITVIREGDEKEIVGITSTFNSWEQDGIYDNSMQTGVILSKEEENYWHGLVKGPSTPVQYTMLQMGDDITTAQSCIMVGSSSGTDNVWLQIHNLFELTGKVQAVIVRAANIQGIDSYIVERGSDNKLQSTSTNNGQPDGLFNEYTLYFDDMTEYTDAEINIIIEGYEPVFLNSVTIVQEGSEETPPSGKCGDNLSFKLTRLPYTTTEFDEETGQSNTVPAYRLTITGTGDMYDYGYMETPWYSGYRYKITEIELPDGMTRVGNYAFYGMSQAQTGELPSLLESIGDYAFWNVLGWWNTDLRFPAHLTSIGHYAFQFSGSFNSIHVPASLTRIEESSLCAIYGVENIYVDEANPVYKADGNALIEKATNKMIAGCKNTIIPNYVTTIGTYALYNIRTETMLIPSSVVTISDYAFCNAAITEIEIPSSVTAIGRSAFSQCRNLVKVTIGSGVKSIGTSAFYGSTSIADVNCYANPDELTWQSTTYENWSFKPDRMTKMHVKAEDLSKWKTDFSFLNVEFIGDLDTSVGLIKASVNNVWHDLTGRKLQGTPTEPGIYIKNGRKELISPIVK